MDELIIHTDSGMDLSIVINPEEADNNILITWFFATDYVDSIDVRASGDTVWTTITKEEWQDGKDL